jgi:hypothetical protein
VNGFSNFFKGFTFPDFHHTLFVEIANTKFGKEFARTDATIGEYIHSVGNGKALLAALSGLVAAPDKGIKFIGF